MAQLLRGDLIGGHTNADIRSCGFPRLASREKTRIRPSMITRTITIAPGFVQFQTFDHLKMIAQLSKWRK